MESNNLYRRLVPHRYRKPFRVLIAVLAGLILVLAVGGSALYASVTSGLPDVTKLDQYDPASTTKIFASDGTLIATLFDENRTYAKYENIAPVMVSALVAIEDRRFFQHDGVDAKGIARAVFGNTAAGGKEQGASTLTMQLARRLFLTEERSYARKVREAVLARRIDSSFSKEKILELYLNEVYFGSGAYGIDSAAAIYFGKNPDKLELWQAGILAGLVQAPTAFSPLDDKPAALKRLDEVLQAMLAEGKITEVQKKAAQKKAAAYRFVDRPLPTGDGMLKYPYFSTYVIRQLADQFPENFLRRGGLQVVTTLDIKIQEQAEKALRQGLEGPGRALGADAGAVVVLDNESGDLVAMVGGPGWSSKSQFNAAWQARRQPGSSFKVFIYAAALEAGYTPEHEFADTEATFSPGHPEEWKPQNSDSTFMGAIPLRTGLQFSRNLVAAKLIAHLGPNRVITLAHRMGIDSELPAVASLALGAGEVTPLQMARAFSALPLGGVLRPTFAIKKVTNSSGQILKSFSSESDVDRVVSKETATMMCEMLHRVVTGGTAQAANISGTFVAGKTGTTDNFKDAWFAGFTPHHTIAVWIGRNDNKPMERMYGGTLPAEIFRTVAKGALNGRKLDATLPGVKFDKAQSLSLCWDSTYLATPSCPKRYNDVFQAGVVATRVCPIHRQVALPQTVPTLTNAPTSADPLATNTPAPIASSAVLSEASIPDNLNPRKDPEVVSPEGSIIPYKETPPTLKHVKFVIKGTPARGGVQASPTPSVENGEVIESTEGPPLTDADGLPLTEADPAISVDAPREGQVEAAPGSLGTEPDYPKAKPDMSTGTDEVIYQPEESVPSTGEPVIPADSTGQ